ncbi:MAG: hypothetical protein HC880_19790 [Bacteroidia bacterium]|nr:hypothetical protein [Bacteroidia bacterium]
MRGQLLYAALIAKYQAEIQEALATLDIYFNNPVGIGEHPQHLEEMDKMMEKMSNAEDKLENIKKYFNPDGSLKESVPQMLAELLHN